MKVGDGDGFFSSEPEVVFKMVSSMINRTS
jgi:hypothetical protein